MDRSIELNKGVFWPMIKTTGVKKGAKHKDCWRYSWQVGQNLVTDFPKDKMVRCLKGQVNYQLKSTIVRFGSTYLEVAIPNYKSLRCSENPHCPRGYLFLYDRAPAAYIS